MRIHPWAFPAFMVGVAAIEVLVPFSADWFTERAAHVHLATKASLMWGAFALAAALATLSDVRRAFERYFEGVDALSSRALAAWLGTAAAAVAAQTCFLKYCQYRAFQLPQDTAAMANTAYYIVRHGTFESSVSAMKSAFAVHFSPIMALYAPLILLGDGALVLLLVQQALIATAPAALFLLARGAGAGALTATSVFLLAWTSSFFKSMSTASAAPQLALPVFFLWGMLSFERDRPRWGVLFLLLMTLCVEQAALTLFGLGLYLVALGRRGRGAGLCAASVALFLLEMAVVSSHSGAEGVRAWGTFAHLGPDPASAARAAAVAPGAFLLKLIWPLERLEPLWRMFYTTAFLGVLAPARLLPWGVSYLPNFLGASGSMYHALTLHYPAYVIGPLWWASAHGAARAARFLEPRRAGGFLLSAALLGAGFSLCASPGFITPGRGRLEFVDGPKAIALIPRDSSVWASEYFTPWLAERAFLRAIPQVDGADFARDLFLPDYILLAKGLIVHGDPTFRARMAAFIKAEGYRRVAELPSAMVFQHPRAPLTPAGGRPPAAALPPPQAGVDFVIQVEPGR